MQKTTYRIPVKPAWPTKWFLALLCGATLGWSTQTTAQAVQNDECSRAIALTQVVNFCSAPGAYSNQNATFSSVARPSCFPDETNIRDVWFSFVARASDVNVSVVGNTALSPGGTLTRPQLAIYSGSCNALTQVACISDGFSINTVQTFVGQLRIGATYYIRVAARGGASGTFQLCINNFNQSPTASSDCPTANILCTKAPFTVASVKGEGKDANEIAGVCGRIGCQPEESQSTWFRWTCQQAGTLTFKITPLNPVDDIDFVLYELPRNINDCAGKQAVRCMSAGENVGQPLSQWRSCTGATGLRDGERDQTEFCGCEAGYNNFVAPLDMVAGRSYALVINNYTASGSGFTLEFGGTGTFLGPQANFTIDQPSACIGKAVTLTDSSFFSGGIAQWDWFFGPNATPANTSGKGPHQVRFDRPGDQTVVLNVRTSDGCVVSNVKTLNASCCGGHFSANARLANPLCPDSASGSIDLQVSSLYAPYQFKWASGQQSEDLSNLTAGSFQVTVSDRATCDTVLNFSLKSPPPIQIATQIKMPTCAGGQDGELTVQATGATPPFRYQFPGQAFGPGNKATRLPVGNYLVGIRDSNNCRFDTLVPVRELELVLDPNIVSVQMPSCIGLSDGQIVVKISNGLPPFRYDWKDGKGFRNENSLLEIKAGAYSVEVLDSNRCRGSFIFDVKDFPKIGLQINARNPLCYGGLDGKIEVLGTGGAGGYRYIWQNGQTQPSRDNLVSGTYPIQVSDKNNCSLDTFALLSDPPELAILDIDATDVLCFGEKTGVVSLLGTGGTAPYAYSVAGLAFRADNTFRNLEAGTYVASVRDANGCTSSQEIRISQPDLLWVAAGADQIVNLGEQVKLQANPSRLPVVFQWSPAAQVNCATCAAPTAQPLETGYFTVIVTDPNGCIATDSLKILVQKNRPLFIPNTFSPNADGSNDYFTIFGGPSARSIRLLRVFDRWGELLFEGKDLPIGSEPLGWDGNYKGEALPSATYIYYAEVEFIDGAIIQVKGDVNLLR